MNLPGRKKESTCPYLGEVENLEEGTWQCRYPNRREVVCQLAQPGEWEQKCPYVLETKAAVSQQKKEIQSGKSSQEPLTETAQKFIKSRLDNTNKEYAAPESSSKPLYTPQHIPEAKYFLLTRMQAATYGKSVLFYYLAPEDYDTLIEVLSGVEEKE